MIDRKRLLMIPKLYSLFAVSIVGVLIFFAQPGRSMAKEDDLVPASSCGKGFSGRVEVNRVKMSDGEQVLQIIDHEHLVICYGKTAPAGASTISCQKFTEKK